MLLKKITNRLPLFIKRSLKKNIYGKDYIPPVGNVIMGDFSSMNPFSRCFGYDRGGPVDRYYIENFLAKESSSISGNVLEIGDNHYTTIYGGNNVEKSDILHIDENNPKATIIADISNAPHVAENTFDCLIFTQTLHLIYDFKAALNTCFRILKPGGTLLMTVPGITPIDHDEWGSTWYWSFTDRAITKLMKEIFPDSNAEVKTFGNVHAATAFLYGMGVSEVSAKKLDYNDPYFQVVITVKAVKPF